MADTQVEVPTALVVPNNFCDRKAIDFTRLSAGEQTAALTAY